MSRRNESSIEEFIEWINRLDDPYKIFVFTMFNVVFFVYCDNSRNGLDPNAINEFVAGTVIETRSDESLNFVWPTLIQPVLLIVGIVQLTISLYTINLS